MSSPEERREEAAEPEFGGEHESVVADPEPGGPEGEPEPESPEGLGGMDP